MKKVFFIIFALSFSLGLTAQVVARITHSATLESVSISNNGIIHPTFSNPIPLNSGTNYITMNSYTGVVQLVTDDFQKTFNSINNTSILEDKQLSIHTNNGNLIFNRGSLLYYGDNTVRCYLIKE
jgi:hypothetical protein